MKSLLLAAIIVLHGVVLQVEPGDRAFVHHDAFGGMPAMTMEFSLPHGTVVHPGDRISGVVDKSHEPWTLSNVKVVAATTPPPIPATPSPLAKGDAVPDVPFLDQSGRPVLLSSLRGQAYALTFIYTRCQDAQMCPLISSKFHAVESKLPPGTQLVEVTLDPSYDRPPILARYAQTFGASEKHWLLLTGQPRSVLSFAQRFGVFEQRVTGQTIVHTERLALVDRSGKVAGFLDDPTWSPARLIAELDSLR